MRMRGNAPDRTSNNRALKNIDDIERMGHMYHFEEIRVHVVVPRDFFAFWLLYYSDVTDIGK